MRREHTRKSLNMVMEMFSANSHKPIRIQCFKNRKISVMKIYYITFISRNHYRLLIFCMVSFSLNICFNAHEERCEKILHYLHWYEMLFSEAEL